ncbi:alanine racemase [Henriciella aquimarina]|uniref:alanine racemase n=1 Tax=Henriciella aquimarina TaxID=545261 RepID=UPI000A070D8A|nr:alanine racemase [Henriciella aquimarina]
MTTKRPLTELQTPALLLDRARMRANIKRMADHVGKLGTVIRPHVKTHKSAQVMQDVIAGGNTQGITVSTLREAEYFFDQGERDILYAVGIIPSKLEAIAALVARGARIKIILDSVEAARLVAEKAAELGLSLPVLIELDVDGHRSGIAPDGDQLIPVADAVLQSAPHLRFRGVMTHAGESYHATSEADLKAAARNERDMSVHAADRLRQAGIEVDEVSIGATPTGLFAEDLSGITEVRVGVYVFFDLVMAGIGVCDTSEIALSVLASVIGHQADKQWAITDAGWMAMSRDRGTANQAVDQGYGLVLGLDGEPMEDFFVARTNQEHGIIESRSGAGDPTRLAIGDRVRILPNHACATASEYDRYYVIEDGEIVAEWPRINGW